MQIFYFLSRPSVYTLPGTWEKQPLIKHGNYPGLPPEGQIVVIILALLLFYLFLKILQELGSFGYCVIFGLKVLSLCSVLPYKVTKAAVSKHASISFSLVSQAVLTASR